MFVIISTRDKCCGLVDIGQRGAEVEYDNTHKKEESSVNQGKVTANLVTKLLTDIRFQSEEFSTPLPHLDSSWGPLWSVPKGTPSPNVINLKIHFRLQLRFRMRPALKASA
jgi:hypothetical protein